MKTRSKHWWLALPLACAFSAPARAAEHVIHMRNTSKTGQGNMVFEPAYLKAAVGDTVVFKPADKGGHNSVSTLLPPGAKAWKGGTDAELKVVIEKEGVYFYECFPHRVMAMVGVIQAGKPVNLADAKAAADKAKTAFAMNKDRLDKALAQVQ